MTPQSPIQPRASLDLGIHSANPLDDRQFNGSAPAGFPERMEGSWEDKSEVDDEEDNQPDIISEADVMSRTFAFFWALTSKPIRTVIKHWDLKQA